MIRLTLDDAQVRAHLRDLAKRLGQRYLRPA
jgi:hypothetical protein